MTETIYTDRLIDACAAVLWTFADATGNERRFSSKVVLRETVRQILAGAEWCEAGEWRSCAEQIVLKTGRAMGWPREPKPAVRPDHDGRHE